MVAMKRIITTFLVSMHALLLINGQNFIGMHKDNIADALKQDYPDFRLDKTNPNSTYNYLKFVDNISEQTILFFLSDDDVCTYVRWISDYANLNDMNGILNRKYRKNGENSWIYSQNGKRYTVTLEEEEWYFTVNIREESE